MSLYSLNCAAAANPGQFLWWSCEGAQQVETPRTAAGKFQRITPKSNAICGSASDNNILCWYDYLHGILIMDIFPEPWLRGSIPGVHPLVAPVLYAFQQERDALLKSLTTPT